MKEVLKYKIRKCGLQFDTLTSVVYLTLEYNNFKTKNLPCHKLGSYRFSPSIHICNQGGNDESILSLFLGFLQYILHRKDDSMCKTTEQGPQKLDSPDIQGV